MPTRRSPFGALRNTGAGSPQDVWAAAAFFLVESLPLLKRQLAAATLAEVVWRNRFNLTFVAAHDTSPGVRVRAPARNGKGSANAGRWSCADFLEILTV